MHSRHSEHSPASLKARVPERRMRQHLMRGAACSIALLLAALSPNVSAQAQQGWFCGPLEAGYGPFDYRTTPYEKREVVERFHFTPSVKALTRGQSSGQVGGDIAYTLHAFPNHPAALDAMARLGRKERSPQPRGARYTVECYFERAIRFAPDDPQVRVLYAHYLVGEKRRDEARRQLEAGEQSPEKTAALLYNLGLGFADVGEYEKSLGYAHQAYAAGIELPGLRERLRRAGKWRDERKE